LITKTRPIRHVFCLKVTWLTEKPPESARKPGFYPPDAIRWLSYGSV
jgi:hypothetical protein